MPGGHASATTPPQPSLAAPPTLALARDAPRMYEPPAGFVRPDTARPAPPPADAADAARPAAGDVTSDVTSNEARPATAAPVVPFELLYELAPAPYVVTTAEGRIVQANRAAARLLRRPAGALVGLALANFVEARERRAFQAALARVHTARDVEEWPMRLAVPGAAPVDCRVRAARLPDTGRPIHAAAPVADGPAPRAGDASDAARPTLAWILTPMDDDAFGG